MNSTGKSDGFTLRKLGGVVISTGKSALCDGQRGLHVERRRIDVAIEIKLNGDAGRPERG